MNHTNETGIESEENFELAAWIISPFVTAYVIAFTLYYLTSQFRDRAVSDKVSNHLKFRFVAIMIVPQTFGVASLISLYFHSATAYFEAIQQVNEAFAIFCFSRLIIWKLGGKEQLKGILRKAKRLPKNCSSILIIGTMQFTIVKPALAIVTLILEEEHLLDVQGFPAHWNEPWVYLKLINAITTIFAFTCLFIMFRRTKEILETFHTELKFIAIKLTVFIPLVQTSMLESIAKNETISKSLADNINHFMICIEMAIFVNLMAKAFLLNELVDQIGDNVDLVDEKEKKEEKENVEDKESESKVSSDETQKEKILNVVVDSNSYNSFEEKN